MVKFEADDALASAAPKAAEDALNSDAVSFGGSNMGNRGGLPSDATPWQGQPHSILVTVPPLAVVYFKPE